MATPWEASVRRSATGSLPAPTSRSRPIASTARRSPIGRTARNHRRRSAGSPDCRRARSSTRDLAGHRRATHGPPYRRPSGNREASMDDHPTLVRTTPGRRGRPRNGGRWRAIIQCIPLCRSFRFADLLIGFADLLIGRTRTTVWILMVCRPKRYFALSINCCSTVILIQWHARRIWNRSVPALGHRINWSSGSLRLQNGSPPINARSWGRRFS